MIVLFGVREFPCGIRTQEMAARFAEHIDAELVFADGEPARQAVAALPQTDDVLLLGHAPPRRMGQAFRESPCPVVVAPAGVSAPDWGEVVLGSNGEAGDEGAAATAGVLAARLGAPMRVVLVRPDEPTQGGPLDELVQGLAHTALTAAGTPFAVDAELRVGPPAAELLRAAEERDTALIVVAADPAPRWPLRLRPSPIAALVHGAREPVVVVPPGSGLGREDGGTRRPAEMAPA